MMGILQILVGIVVGFVGLLVLAVIFEIGHEFHRRNKRRKIFDAEGRRLIDNFIAAHEKVLAQRLDAQRKDQIRHIKERDASDHDLFDKVKEYRHDFDGPGEAG